MANEIIRSFLGTEQTVPLSGSYVEILSNPDEGRDAVFFYVQPGAILEVSNNSSASLPWYRIVGGADGTSYAIRWGANIRTFVKGSGTIKYQEVVL